MKVLVQVFCLMSAGLYVRGRNFNLQGGAISVEDGAVLKISSSAFKRNQAGDVSAIFAAV